VDVFGILRLGPRRDRDWEPGRSTGGRLPPRRVLRGYSPMLAIATFALPFSIKFRPTAIRAHPTQRRGEPCLHRITASDAGTEPPSEWHITRVPNGSSARYCAGWRSRCIRTSAGRDGHSTIFQKESLRVIFPATNSSRSTPRTSRLFPETDVPVIVHSETPKEPQAQCWSSP